MSTSAKRRVAVVTGTNRATGNAIAHSLHEQDWSIVSVNRTLSSEDWMQQHKCEFTDADEVVSTARRISTENDEIHTFIATAVSRNLAPIADITADQYHESVMVNLTSVVLTIRELLPSIRRARGHIVVIGSHAGSRCFEGGTAYSTTKAALKALVETLLLEERQNGVTTTLVSPGAIANFDHDHSPYKMTTESVAHCVRTLITSTPEDVAVGEVEVRPANIPPPEVSGLDRLNFV
ncbi:NAD(P)-dependent dehydrogenase (short-subunit alcohol dehydrogenase family) [Actinopolyspora biskrensis]|uniref:NAD(P)-dependent dehydrogenase (Short-subunit alcohol dehydrogenase family) n=1 Tax=Actinopolyspora biskrensis TaxID=1470178 RepID=A0A852Z4C5_9ACTN|nr:SDR family NAD(P)-dependent oxidoreductase [Actinopolyspora biskrensis]NYH80155.1 NAD(P)-dependent dehydrogenase (short-subunit alcohol dehydrogenase family) [Actinopolyspora biskrensis]